MKVARWCMTAVLVMGLVAVAVPSGRAQAALENPESPPIPYGAELGTSEEIQRWWGALGAAICGTEMWLIRTNPTLGMNPFALAAGISGCVLALMDAAT